MSGASRGALLAMLVAGAASCVSLPSPTAPVVRLFTLSETPVERSKEPPTAGTLRVEEPAAATLYRGTGIALRDSSRTGEIRYSKEGRFAASIGGLLGDRLATIARDLGSFEKVVFPGQGGAVDWVLRGRLERFEGCTVASGLVARAVLTLELVRTRDARTVLSRRYEEEVPSQGSTVDALVAAFSRAIDQIAARALGDAAAAASAAAPSP